MYPKVKALIPCHSNSIHIIFITNLYLIILLNYYAVQYNNNKAIIYSDFFQTVFIILDMIFIVDKLIRRHKNELHTNKIE